MGEQENKNESSFHRDTDKLYLANERRVRLVVLPVYILHSSKLHLRHRRKVITFHDQHINWGNQQICICIQYIFRCIFKTKRKYGVEIYTRHELKCGVSHRLKQTKKRHDLNQWKYIFTV